MMTNAPMKQKPKFSVAISTPAYQRLISSTLQDPARVRTFTSAITSAVAVNPALQDCDAGTILAGALLGESLNLSPSPQLGQYYLVPFKQKHRDENGAFVTESKAQFILGYKGYIQLAIRTGYYLDIDAMEIKDGEYQGRDPFTGKARFAFIEDDTVREKTPTVGYMAYFEYQNGFRKVLYWSKEKMLAHADRYSQAFSAEDYIKLQNHEIPQGDMWKYSSFWYKDFDAMAKKTLLRQLISKWGIMSTDLQTAVIKDTDIIKEAGGAFESETVEAQEADETPIYTAEPQAQEAPQEQSAQAQQDAQTAQRAQAQAVRQAQTQARVQTQRQQSRTNVDDLAYIEVAPAQPAQATAQPAQAKRKTISLSDL